MIGPQPKSCHESGLGYSETRTKAPGPSLKLMEVSKASSRLWRVVSQYRSTVCHHFQVSLSLGSSQIEKRWLMDWLSSPDQDLLSSPLSQPALYSPTFSSCYDDSHSRIWQLCLSRANTKPIGARNDEIRRGANTRPIDARKDHTNARKRKLKT
jgi:hypothetical protein